MPAPIKRVPRRPPSVPGDVAYIARYFASAGTRFRDRPPVAFWLPWAWADELRNFWNTARDEVKDLVPARAFEMMEAEFGPDGKARQFEVWPQPEMEEIYELCGLRRHHEHRNESDD